MIDTKKTVNKLLEKYRPEVLAVAMGRSVATINKWKFGKSVASKGDSILLEQISQKGIGND